MRGVFNDAGREVRETWEKKDDGYYYADSLGNTWFYSCDYQTYHRENADGFTIDSWHSSDGTEHYKDSTGFKYE